MHNGTTAFAGSMVRDRLSRFWSGVRTRINEYQSLGISIAAAGALTLGLTGWVLTDQEDLSPVVVERGRQRENIPSSSGPCPHKSLSWSSPLARQCSGVDTALRSRLNQLDARSSSGEPS